MKTSHKLSTTTKLNRRQAFAYCYLAISIATIIILLFFMKQAFPIVNLANWNIYYRLIWCFAFELLGFSLLVFVVVHRQRKALTSIEEKPNGQEKIEKKKSFEENDFNPCPSYYTSYLFKMLITSVFPFFIFTYYFSQIQNLYYAGTIAMSLAFGYYIDADIFKLLLGKASEN